MKMENQDKFSPTPESHLCEQQKRKAYFAKQYVLRIQTHSLILIR